MLTRKVQGIPEGKSGLFASQCPHTDTAAAIGLLTAPVWVRPEQLECDSSHLEPLPVDPSLNRSL